MRTYIAILFLMNLFATNVYAEETVTPAEDKAVTESDDQTTASAPAPESESTTAPAPAPAISPEEKPAEPAVEEKIPARPEYAVILIPGKKQKAILTDQAIEYLISRFIREKDIIGAPVGKELFGIQTDDEIRECFAKEGCMREFGVKQQIGRILYGTIVKEKGKVPVKAAKADPPAKGKKKAKKTKKASKMQPLLSIEMTLLDVIYNRIEMQWTCQKCAEQDLNNEKLPDIATKTIAIMKARPLNWMELNPGKRADGDAFLGLQPQSLEVLPPPPQQEKAEGEAESKEPEVEPKAVTENNKTVDEVPPPPEIKKPVWPVWTSIALMGAGVAVAAGGGTYFGLQADAAKDNYSKTNVQLKALTYKSDFESNKSTANIMFIAGGATLVAGTTMFILYQLGIFDPDKPPQALIVPADGAIAFQFSF